MKENDKEEQIQDESKINDLDASNLNNLRLTCPECDLIPALFYDIKSKNIYEISASCENKHLINCLPVKKYYDKCMKIKSNPKESFNDFLCIQHNSNFIGFCKNCKKNICKECSDFDHKNHFISKFYELLPSNEEIIQLKNSIDNEINDINELLVKTFNKWIIELQVKFDELIQNLKAKNNLYNFIINFYETKEFNYQNIYNIKIVAENQLKRNPLMQEIQTLKNIIMRNEGLLNIQKKNQKKEEYEETKNNYFNLKTAELIKILSILNTNMNKNYKFESFESAEKSLQHFLDDNDSNNTSIKSSSGLSDYLVINPYNKSKSVTNDISKNNVNDINSNEQKKEIKPSLTMNEKMLFANEIKLKKRKLNQSLSQNSIVHYLTVLKDYKGKAKNKFAAGLDNGTINIYYIDSKTNNIYLDFEIKEHSKAVTYIKCLENGRIITCSQDGTMKLIEETISYSYLLSFWRRYYLIQTLVKPGVDKYNIFQPVSIIEINSNTLVSGDWKSIIIWKLIKVEEKRHKKREKINFSFDIIDYKKNKYNYYYEIFKEINITTSVTSLLNIDGSNFVSAHYGAGIVTFYNIYDDSKKSVENIKCVDSSTQCMDLIEVPKAESNLEKGKIIVIGGYKIIYLLSAKDKNLIDKISFHENDYIKCVINSGIKDISNGFICAGLFNQSTYDIVHYNAKNHLGFSELTVKEISRIKDTSKGAINSVIFLKKNLFDETMNQNNMIVIIGGNDQCIKTYIENEEEED